MSSWFYLVQAKSRQRTVNRLNSALSRQIDMTKQEVRKRQVIHEKFNTKCVEVLMFTCVFGNNWLGRRGRGLMSEFGGVNWRALPSDKLFPAVPTVVKQLSNVQATPLRVDKRWVLFVVVRFFSSRRQCVCADRRQVYGRLCAAQMGASHTVAVDYCCVTQPALLRHARHRRGIYLKYN